MSKELTNKEIYDKMRKITSLMFDLNLSTIANTKVSKKDKFKLGQLLSEYNDIRQKYYRRHKKNLG